MVYGELGRYPLAIVVDTTRRQEDKNNFILVYTSDMTPAAHS